MGVNRYFYIIFASGNEAKLNSKPMNQTTTTAVHLQDFTIYPERGQIYAHNECELFHVRDLTLDDLTRLHSDLLKELGQDRADEVMQQLTANK